MKLMCIDEYRDYTTGDVIDTRHHRVSSDDINFYVHGVPDEHPHGCHSSYTVLPMFAFINCDDDAMSVEGRSLWIMT